MQLFLNSQCCIQATFKMIQNLKVYPSYKELHLVNLTRSVHPC